MTEVGFIGLGNMGRPMVRRLLDAGHFVHVHNRSPGPVEDMVAAGAVAAGSSTEVARRSDVVLTALPTPSDVDAVYGEMLAEARAGQLFVEHSTIRPSQARGWEAMLAKRGARYLDAPLSGGTAGAQRGTLTLMVGGDAAVLADTEPALEPFAGLIVHVGGPGMGQVVKLCNNLIYAAQMTATAEATALAAKSGVDMAKLLEVLTHATGDCVAVRTRLPVPGVVPDSPASNGWQPGFMTDLMAKDLDLAMAYAARTGVPVATTATARQLLTAASAAGYGREDFSAVAKVVLALAGAPAS